MHRLKIIGWIKIFHAKGNEKKTGVIVHNEKGINPAVEDRTLVNIYAPT